MGRELLFNSVSRRVVAARDDEQAAAWSESRAASSASQRNNRGIVGGVETPFGNSVIVKVKGCACCGRGFRYVIDRHNRCNDCVGDGAIEARAE